jgi:hypothetical protein
MSTYNNPDTSVSFDLIDTGGSSVATSGVKVYVDDVLVVEAGVPVVPSGLGYATFSKISDSYYSFQYTPTSPFSPDRQIIISGTAYDSESPANVEYFSYYFKVWKTADLTASIVGLADAEAPYLTNLLPGDLAEDVVVTSDVSLDVVDDHTGVDLDTVAIFIEGDLVYSGTELLSDAYALTVSGVYNDRGYRFIFDPVTNFDYGQDVEVRVLASDSFVPANSVDTAYYFTTVANAHLVASGLEVYEDGAYVDMFVGASYTTSSSTMFHINYFNLSGTGIDLSESKVYLNGTELSSTITPVGGSTTEYDVYFEIDPDYTTDADLVFHVQQSGTVSGEAVYRDFTTELLWGYEFCYDEERLLHDRNYIMVAKTADRGFYPTYTSLVKEFETGPMAGNSLRAEIRGIRPPSRDIGAIYFSNSTYFWYGRTMYIEVEANDFAGNILLYNWYFTIEDEPEE